LFYKDVPLLDIAVLEVVGESSLTTINRGIVRVSTGPRHHRIHDRCWIAGIARVVVELADQNALRICTVRLPGHSSGVGLSAIEARPVIESSVGRNVRNTETAAHNH